MPGNPNRPSKVKGQAKFAARKTKEQLDALQAQIAGIQQQLLEAATAKAAAPVVVPATLFASVVLLVRLLLVVIVVLVVAAAAAAGNPKKELLWSPWVAWEYNGQLQPLIGAAHRTGAPEDVW
ncbi:hypothetical protein AK812_SmicGene1242 [Symbiodinium microadriaticum]|uniref:Uncharacterized protein n=1 Tax=Symbiodinium microadriaticum TaxID=2951 RepID=A0A1Q9F4L1_SYMMI|nr:hypothetical protein AK812_SmicGene1242 [Symbiodinium microadriaticum]